MPAMNGPGWQELQTSSRRSCPKLFYQFSTTNESYTLLLTDLICIWETTLDKYDIEASARRQHSSIDPSSSDQLDVLLSKLRKSLSNSNNTITRSTTDRDSKTLLLETKTVLPGPLKPLIWTFTLEAQPTSSLAEQILRPSLHEVSVSASKITSLVNVVKEKDHVITSLLESIGNSGVDLSLVFPGHLGARGSRKGNNVSVSDAKKRVPGMAVFEEEKWLKMFANEDDDYEGADRTGLGNLVKGCEKCFVHTTAEHENWIKELPKASSDNTSDGQRNGTKSEARKGAAKKKASDDDASTEDEFERQATPPQLKSRTAITSQNHHHKRQPDSDASDARDNDDGPPSKCAKTSKLGGIGKRNATKAAKENLEPQTQSPTPASVTRKAPQARRQSTDSTASETASEDDENIVKPSSTRPRTISPVVKISKSSPVTRKDSSPIPTRSRQTRSSTSPASAKDDRKTQDDDETDTASEDDDLDGPFPPQTRAKAPSSSQTPAKSHKLGRIAKKARSASPAKPPSQRQSENETDSEADEAKDKSPSPPPPSTQSTPKKVSKLGGLRKKAPANPSQNRHSSPTATRTKRQDGDNSATPSPSPEAPSKSRRPKDSSATPDEDQEPPSSSHIRKKEPEPKKKETAEGAAQRRRMELKRTIEQGAGKKKRRF